MKRILPTRREVFRALVTCLLVLGPGQARAQSEQKIVVLVNDQPISAYDIDQRLQFMALSTRQEATAKLRKQVIKSLIDEALMLQEAKKASVTITPDKIMRTLDAIAKRNSSTADKVIKAFADRGVKDKTIKQQIEARMAWRRTVKRKYYGAVRIGESQIDKALSGTEGGESQNTEFQVRRVRLVLPKDHDQRAVAVRLVEAEQLRSGFKSCESISDLMKGVRKASVRDISRKAADQVPQPVRAFLLKSKAGQMTPPSVTPSSIEFYAVCGRRSVKTDSKQRAQVEAKLREQELQIRARRYLRDLRQDAFIEYR